MKRLRIIIIILTTLAIATMGYAYQCSICELFFAEDLPSVCAVNHALGDCCHLGEIHIDPLILKGSNIGNIDIIDIKERPWLIPPSIIECECGKSFEVDIRKSYENMEAAIGSWYEACPRCGTLYECVWNMDRIGDLFPGEPFRYERIDGKVR